MNAYEKRRMDGQLRLQWELVVEPEIRKVLTLDQITTVFRRTLQPQQLTQEDAEVELSNADQLLAGQNGSNVCHTRQGTWWKEGLQVTYGMDDAIENNPDGTLSAAFFWWELPEAETERVEPWFQAVIQALNEAQENLLCFGHI